MFSCRSIEAHDVWRSGTKSIRARTGGLAHAVVSLCVRSTYDIQKGHTKQRDLSGAPHRLGISIYTTQEVFGCPWSITLSCPGSRAGRGLFITIEDPAFY